MSGASDSDSGGASDSDSGNASDSASIKVGLSTPWDIWELAPEEQRARLAAAADGGIDHLFCADHVSFHGGQGADGIVHMAALAGIEPRLDLYVGVFLLVLRHPMVAARQIASLCQATAGRGHGRVTIGVGVGGEDRHEIEVCGIDPATRGAKTDVALDLVRRLLAGESVDGDGRFYHFTDGLIRPRPKPSVPFVVGGRSDAAVRRAGRLGDGWLAAWCSPRRFAEATAMAAGVADAAGRRDVAWQHGLQVWLGIGDTPDEGRSHVGPAMENFYRIPFDAFARYTPCGTPAEIADALVPYVEAGATTFNLTPVGGDADAELAAVAEIKHRLMATLAG